ncbi:MAG: AAA family ATPase [Deltaproteobacteria bacterium]|nr:AAA family ATPase [Deltaproteobacteria bacterium]MBW1951061.1 AAA family ATPase [Deltaproteobacteria bacterium]MBW2006850.1 AAA family ATPase [Deltaproteobacteria bacterium]MBW2102632.1 AAA family ATPase [Deltaproteobacteria bacterium]MBW2349353.1 AAA family ATPase [Deltaproteobacteria bacterium]
MYEEFYGLSEKPFNLTPSPRFVYLGEVHKEALALLTYGVVERKGFILLTGEVGTGKTTMVQALLSNLDNNIQYIYLSNPVISREEFLDYIAFSAFKRKIHFKSKTEFLYEFEEFLKDCLQHQKTFLLIIDEAHKLSLDLLEEVRLLSNMETADEKLINIFLVGQPELNETLAMPECRALLQRISIRYHIKPLDLKGTREYVAARMETAGSKDWHKIFTKGAVKALFECSTGYPRMINILADNALLLGYSREKKQISSGMVKECHQDIQLEAGTPSATPPPAGEPPVQAEKKRAGWAGALRWAILCLSLVFLVLILSRRSTEFYDFFSKLMGETAPAHKADHVKRPLPPRTGGGTLQDRLDSADPTGKTDTGTLKGQGAAESRISPESGTPMAHAREPKPPPVPTAAAEPVRPKPEEPPKIVVVKEGDTLTGLAASVYGWVDEGIIEMLKRSNPQIRDINWIDVGQKITFPPIHASKQGVTYTVHIASFKPFANARELFQQLIDQGHEAYIIPVIDPDKGKIYRVTLGSFTERLLAVQFASDVVKRGISDYARAIRLEMR